jgi:hypothetical protein
LGRLDRIQQLRTGDEDHAGAGEREQVAADARIGLEIQAAALHRAQRDGIDH